MLKGHLCSMGNTSYANCNFVSPCLSTNLGDALDIRSANHMRVYLWRQRRPVQVYAGCTIVWMGTLILKCCSFNVILTLLIKINSQSTVSVFWWGLFTLFFTRLSTMLSVLEGENILYGSFDYYIKLYYILYYYIKLLYFIILYYYYIIFLLYYSKLLLLYFII